MPKAHPPSRAKLHCQAPPLQRRLLPAEPDTWRATSASDRPLPRFFLHDNDGSNFSVVQRGLRGLIGNRLAEEVIPIAFSQYLVDLPLIEALETHPSRTRDPQAAEWHILAAMPFASRLWGLLQSNVSADGGRCCLPSGDCRVCSAAAFEGVRLHQARLRSLVAYLGSSTWWRQSGVPFAVLSTGISINHDLGSSLLGELLQRNARVGPVILGGVDRSGIHATLSNFPLLRRMVVLPHVASPECAAHAFLCQRDERVRRRRKKEAELGLAHPMAMQTHSPVLASALAHGVCQVPTARRASSASVVPSAHRGDDPPAATAPPPSALAKGDAAWQRSWWASAATVPAHTRTGFVFHGDHGRFDFGARGAVRDVSAQHLRAPHDFRGLRLMLHGGSDASSATTVSRERAHAAHRSVSRHTTKAMLGAAVCFVPRGDTDTSRRLFDAMATGCVPVIVKVVGGKPALTMMTNLPFHHTLSWRGLAHFLSAGGARLEHRHAASDGWIAVCRTEEAVQLDAWHDDLPTLAALRRNAMAAFASALDVELHPHGVANAFLRELAYVLTDLPTSLHLPPPHVLPAGMQHWPNMTQYKWLWDPL